ncbi:type VI secretion protein VasK, partial [Pectobacterium odoriferum]
METSKDKLQNEGISVAFTVVLAAVAITFLILLGGLIYWFFVEDHVVEWSVIYPVLLVSGLIWIALACVVSLVFLAVHLWIISRIKRSSTLEQHSLAKKRKIKPLPLVSEIARTLCKRHGWFWRRKTRLLLVTGEPDAIDQLTPGLRENQWLEGHRTVLIYGGSLTAEIDAEKYTALRKLRRGRPLDGIVRVMPESLNLTSQISDNDLRGLEKVGELLRYQPPVWLWQLCDSDWSQNGRTEQAVGAFFPLRAKPDDITRQLENLLPALNAQGMSQVVENNSHDFLLRLGQHLKESGISRWAQQLTPWLYANQQRVPLRGLVFSLPEAAS